MISLLSTIIGTIEPPPGVSRYTESASGGAAPGLINFVTNVVKLAMVLGGLYAMINFILAGYGYLSAGGDPKKIQAASAKIWQSVIGLLIMAGSFVLSAIFGYLVFGDAYFIIYPEVYGPGS